MAISKEGKVIQLDRKTSELRLKQLKLEAPFFCPECEEALILKAGSKRIPHFSHKRKSDCFESYERETRKHLEGKQLLYEWLTNQGLRPDMESYYHEIRQRADLGFTLHNIKNAIEYQCSIIPEELLLKRNQCYIQAGIRPLWILSDDHYHRKGSQKLSLSSFQYLFLQINASGQTVIPFFSPQTNTFLLIHHLMPLTPKSALGKLSFRSLSNVPIHQMLRGSNEPIHFSRWQTEIRRMKTYANIPFGLFPRTFLDELYQSSIYPASLPPEIGIPVKNAYYIATSPIQWQTYLYLDVFRFRKAFSLHEIYNSFKKRCLNQHIKLRALSFGIEGGGLVAVREYVEVLRKLRILSTSNHFDYYLEKPIQMEDNLQHLLEIEKNFYQQYGEKIMRNAIK